MRENKKYIIEEMRKFLEKDFLVLDVETTGLGPTDEVVALGLVNSSGGILINTLVRATQKSSDKAFETHGISWQDTEREGKLWVSVLAMLIGWVQSFHIAAYCANGFDARMIEQTCRQHGTPIVNIQPNLVEILPKYAVYHGDWNDYHGNYMYKKLGVAASALGVVQTEAHSAVGDALTTLGVMKAIANTEIR